MTDAAAPAGPDVAPPTSSTRAGYPRGVFARAPPRRHHARMRTTLPSLLLLLLVAAGISAACTSAGDASFAEELRASESARLELLERVEELEAGLAEVRDELGTDDGGEARLDDLDGRVGTLGEQVGRLETALEQERGARGGADEELEGTLASVRGSVDSVAAAVRESAGAVEELRGALNGLRRELRDLESRHNLLEERFSNHSRHPPG